VIDFLGYEPHFVDHGAPVWHALPESLRGRYLVDPGLVDRAAALGIEAEPVLPPKPRRGVEVPAHDGLAFATSYGDLKKGRRLGYRRFAFLEHGIGQSYAGDPTNELAIHHGSYSGGTDRDDVELFLQPNEHSADRWRRTYPAASVAVVGCPKLDTLPAREPGPGSGPVVCVSFHWDGRSIIPELRSAWHHYHAALRPLAQRYRVIGHSHPRMAGTMSRVFRRLRCEFVEDFADVCRRADVYVTDNSSTLYEFAATGRPVVVLNAPWFRRDVEHGLRFWQASGVGVNVDQPERLPAGIDAALADDESTRCNREAALSTVYAHRSGAAHRAAIALAAWAGQRVEAAA